MTAILGYVTDNSKTNNVSMFLASDGLVKWHTANGDTEQDDFKKIHQFKQFLISFNGEVSLYQSFIKSLESINTTILNTIEDIPTLQEEINKIFPFETFLNSLGLSKAKYSNIIILDTKKRVLAYHYAGNISVTPHLPFDFEFLNNDTLYHFGSKVSFMNDTSSDMNSYFIEPEDCIKSSYEDQVICFKELFNDANVMYRGVGALFSYYLKDSKGVIFKDNI